MPIRVLTAAALASLVLGVGLILLGLDWWSPSPRDLLEYVVGGALLVVAGTLALSRYVGGRRDR